MSDKKQRNGEVVEPQTADKPSATPSVDTGKPQTDAQAISADNTDPQSSNVTALPSADRGEKLRIVEALLFAAAEPLDEATLSENFSPQDNVKALLEELQGFYAGRGVNLVQIGGKWSFRTADDLSFILQRYAVEQKRLSKAALETLSIIAYHQPVTRAEIEEVRGVATSKGTLDVLMETGWVRMRGRRKAPGRPVTYGTSEAFLQHFGFERIKDLPGLKELRGSGLLEGNLPPGFSVPTPDDTTLLQDDEEPLEDPQDELPLEMDVEEEGDGEANTENQQAQDPENTGEEPSDDPDQEAPNVQIAAEGQTQAKNDGDKA